MVKIFGYLNISEDDVAQFDSETIEMGKVIDMMQEAYSKAPESGKKDMLANILAETIRILLKRINPIIEANAILKNPTPSSLPTPPSKPTPPSLPTPPSKPTPPSPPTPPSKPTPSSLPTPPSKPTPPSPPTPPSKPTPPSPPTPPSQPTPPKPTRKKKEKKEVDLDDLLNQLLNVNI